MNTNLQHEKILYLYSQALENSDFETISAIFEQAADDPALKTLLFELDAFYQMEFPVEQQIQEALPMSEPHTQLLESTNGHHPIAVPVRRKVVKLPIKNRHWLLRMAGIMIVFIATVILYRDLSTPSDEVYVELTPSFAGSPITSANATQLTQIQQYGDGYANGALWTPDGEHIIAFGTTGIQIYEPDRLGDEPMISINTDSAVNNAHLSADGTLLATVHNDGTVRIFDMDSHQQIQSIQANNRSLREVAISPDGRMVATGGAYHDSPAGLWSVENGRKIFTFEQSLTTVKDIVFSPDGEMIAWAGLGQPFLSGIFMDREELEDQLVQRDVIYLMNLSSRKSHIIGDTNWDITSLQFSPDGTKLLALTGYNANKFYMWDIENTTPKLLQSVSLNDAINTTPYDGFFYTNRTIQFYSDTTFSLIHVEAVDNTVSISNWDTETGDFEEIIEFPDTTDLFSGNNLSQVILSFAFSPDRSRVLASYNEGSLLVADLNNRQVISALESNYDYSQSFVISPDSSTLAIGSGNVVQVWDIESNEMIASREITGSYYVALAFFPDGEQLAIAHQRTNENNYQPLEVWNFVTDEVEYINNVRFSADQRSVAMNSDGTSIAFLSQNSTLRLYDMDADEVIQLVRSNITDPTVGNEAEVLFKPNDRLLAYAYGDTLIHIVNSDGDEVALLSGNSNAVNDIAFSPDGRYLTAVNQDGYWLMWDTQTWEEASFNDVGAAYSVDFSADGSLIAIGGTYEITLWDTETHEIAATIDGHTRAITDIEFSDDGSLLVSQSTDGTTRLWAIE